MHRLCIALLFLLLIPASALADITDTIGQIGLFYEPSASASQIGIYSPQLYDNLLPGGGIYSGTFTNAISSLTCLNAACTKLSVNLDISGISLNNVEFQGHIYPVIYFSGTLVFAGTLVEYEGGVYGCPGVGICFTGESAVSGDLTACLDPACSTQLFQLDVDPNMRALSTVHVVFDSNGKGVLESARFVNPEPATLLLFATGLAGIGWRKVRAVRTANR